MCTYGFLFLSNRYPQSRSRVRYAAMSIGDKEVLDSKRRENYARRAACNLDVSSDSPMLTNQFLIQLI